MKQEEFGFMDSTIYSHRYEHKRHGKKYEWWIVRTGKNEWEGACFGSQSRADEFYQYWRKRLKDNG